VLVLDMIEVLPPLGRYKYDTRRILPMKCYIHNSVRLRSCIKNINNDGSCNSNNGDNNDIENPSLMLEHC
jgi:hypothetical protein